MASLRLDDLFLEHPKIVGLTAEELRLHLAAMLYAVRHSTDGFVPDSALEDMAARYQDERYCDHRVRYQTLGLWESVIDGVQIHDFSVYNGSHKDRVWGYLEEHPGASANEIQRAVGGRRAQVLDAIKWFPGTTLSGTSGTGVPVAHLEGGDDNCVSGSPVPVLPGLPAKESALNEYVTSIGPTLRIRSEIGFGLQDSGKPSLSGSREPLREIAHVYEHWRRERGKSDRRYASISSRRRQVIKARLEEFSVDELCQAISAVALDDWEARGKHDDLTVLLKTRERVDYWLDVAKRLRPDPLARLLEAAAERGDTTLLHD